MSAKTDTPRTIRLADYTPPPYRVLSVDLTFDLHPTATRVTAVTAYSAEMAGAPLVLNGERMKLISVAIDGRPLAADGYLLTEDSLTLTSPPASFTLAVETEINPEANKALEGLYLSRGKFTTQCEAEGFRRITYYQDRPDVMAPFTVTLRAPKASCPLLLSNGNPGKTGELSDGRHFAVWHDPFPKPCYLFALVAGDLGHIEDYFITRTGRRVRLRIYVEHGKESRATYAMDALTRAMAWDEHVYGREYDLKVFNIVAVSDFNMGAMENKGLNIFNDRLILADPETATDNDYKAIEGVVAHEYFHNWTGDRITCRDWFQLSLKEGLTVFRDQQFSSDMRSAAVQRIEDVNALRIRQFVEDASPLAHPVRPDSYIEINNFYTATVYEKGAEVIGMMRTLLGADGFRRGMDLYFRRHDGQAVTCDDFAAAMQDASGVDLTQFKLWYRQAGTPTVTAEGRYDAANKTYALTLRQTTPPTPGQPVKQPMHMPIAVGLVDRDGRDIALHGGSKTAVLDLRHPVQTFTFEGVQSEPLPSINRRFSAPVIVKCDMPDADRAFLMARDSDSFNRWQAKQDYGSAVLVRMIDAMRAGQDAAIDIRYLDAVGAIIDDPALDDNIRAYLLDLPAEEDVAARLDVEDPILTYRAREALKAAIAACHQSALQRLYDSCRTNAPFSPDAKGAGRRELKSTALSYLAALATEESASLVKTQFDSADNMTDRVAAMVILSTFDHPARTAALNAFAKRHAGDAVVLDKWLTAQAICPLPGAMGDLRRLLVHPNYDAKNPNRIRALVGAFSMRNPVHFHALDGAGYAFLADQIIATDRFNPQTAARLLPPLGRWKRFDAARQAHMKQQLRRIVAVDGLSRDVYELASKSLAD